MNPKELKQFIGTRKLNIVFILIITIFLHLNTNAKTIKGIIVDLVTEKPIPDGIVMLLYQNKIQAIAFADSLGLFTFDGLNIEKFYVHAKRLGYTEVTMGPLRMSTIDTLTLVIKLEIMPIELQEIVVTAKRLEKWLNNIGFYDRQTEGSGKFLTYENLKYRSFGRVSDILRTIPGLVVTETMNGVELFSVRYMSSGLRGASSLNIYLDGIPLRDAEMLNSISPDDVAAIEFYRSSIYAPMQYGGAWRPGGVLLVWTKR